MHTFVLLTLVHIWDKLLWKYKESWQHLTYQFSIAQTVPMHRNCIVCIKINADGTAGHNSSVYYFCYAFTFLPFASDVTVLRQNPYSIKAKQMTTNMLGKEDGLLLCYFFQTVKLHFCCPFFFFYCYQAVTIDIYTTPPSLCCVTFVLNQKNITIYS